MARENIESMADLAKLSSGLIDKVFRSEFERVTEDVIERPGLKTVRRISIDLAISPVVAQDGILDSVQVAWEVKGKVPQQKSAPCSMLCKKGRLTFNSSSPDNAHQRTLDELPPKTE